MIKEAIGSLVEGRSLTFEEASGSMEEIMNGEATASQIGAFLTALRVKGETSDEIAGLASVMRAKAMPVNIAGPAIDIVGTGGDGSGSFNISTAAAFVVAGVGLKVAKHGNRAASSQCGSADILEALGVKIELGPRAVAECIEKVGIGFMFAPVFHPAMKHAAPTRREIGIRTVFNILGPLTNPARVEHMVLGVPGRELGDKIAAVLYRLGTKHSLVVHGADGLDEISISGKSLVWDVSEDALSEPYEISPETFGFEAAERSEILGGTPEENAASLRRILDGEHSALRNTVVMNAAAGLVAGNITADLKQAAQLAEVAIDNGRAKGKLEQLAELSRRLEQS
jgi:anthranilate phosphoribosyltransferase